jgi:uncharacterized phage protein gp47/JayE
MADILDFQSPYDEDVNSIRARVEAAADPDIDKRPGEIFYDITTPIIFEIQRLWDSVNYYSSISFLPWSFGTYLDYKGAYEIGVNRQAAQQATGEVTFIGERDTVIPAGTVTSTSPRVVTDPVYLFETTDDDQIGMLAPIAAPTAVAGLAGAISATVSYRVTFVGRGGETDPSPATTDITVSSKKVELSDLPIGPYGTTARKIYRRDTASGDYRLLATLTNNTVTVYSDNEGSTLATAVAPTDNSTDRVSISTRSQESGEDYNVGIYAIDQLVDAIPGVESVTNESAFTDGADRESDDDYRIRLVNTVLSPAGQGNKADYIRWATEFDGVADAIVLSQWNGANTVKVVLVGVDNSPVSAGIVAEVQAALDPDIDGAGGALAPIGAVVTVQSVAQVNVALSATITHETGYTLDGTDGTAATRAAIIAAVTTYLRTLKPGSSVVWAEVLASIVTVVGVADVSSLTLNGSAVNVTTTSTQIAALGSVTLAQV